MGLAALEARFQRLFETDFTVTRAFVPLAVLFVVLRLPYLHYGYGTDPDAWRVALTAQHLLDTGSYFPSRLPGNPLHELVITLFVPGGWIATNLATALASLAGVWLFARIVRFHQVQKPGLVVIGFAFLPLLFINSVATMDYMWTLTLLLGAYYAALRDRPLLAGLLLGAAIGFRLQSAIFWPVLAYMLWKQHGWRILAPYTLATGGVAALAFAPVLAAYGPDFLNYYDAAVGWRDVLRLLAKESLGIVGSLAVLAGAAMSLSRLKSLPGDVIRDRYVAVWCGIILLYFASFSRLPHEIAYLVPVFPFGLLLMARYYKPLALTVAIAGILLAGMIDITTRSDAVDLASLRTAGIGRGLLLSNVQTMQGQKDFVEAILEDNLPDHSVVISGFIFPQLALRGDDLDPEILQRDYGAISMLSDRGEAVDEAHDIRYVWLLTYDTFEALRSQGYSFFMVPDAIGGTAALYDYRPMLFGASFLELQQKAPTEGRGAANTDR